MQEKNRREQSNRGRHYVPNGKAQEFIEMVGGGELFVSMFVAANGVGKSAAGANIVTNICFGIQNEYFDLPIFRDWPYLKRGRIISDPTTIKEKIIPELEKWFPANEAKNIPEANFELAKEGKNYVCKIETKTGWTIDIMSTEQADKEFESADLGWVWIDEPIPERKFMATVARGRMGMIMFWTMTPLFQAAWAKDWMDTAIENGTADYVEAEVEDNCKIHGVRGILEHDAIVRMVDAMDENEKEARAFGKFGHLIGRVHKKFSRKIHVIDPFPIDVRNYTVYKALDPHPRVDDHVLYLAVDRKGTYYITSEILFSEEVPEMYAQMKAHESNMNYRLEGSHSRIIDPSAFNDDKHMQEKSVGSQFHDLGERWIRGSKDLMAGIKRTDTALDYKLKEGKLFRPPELFIFSTCPVLIKQMEEYVWSEWKGASKDEKQPNPRPKDKNDHNVENLHRLLLHEPEYIPYKRGKGTTGYVDYEEEYRELDPYA